MVTNWKKLHPTDGFYLQHKSDGHPLIFSHQTEQQRRLLERYGQELCLMDATYKTCKFAVCTFFIAVKTNNDYQVYNTTEKIVLDSLEKCELQSLVCFQHYSKPTQCSLQMPNGALKKMPNYKAIKPKFFIISNQVFWCNVSSFLV